VWTSWTFADQKKYTFEMAVALPLRKIIHVDMDAFYASVEQRDRPELRGRPVAVGGAASGRGVVAACSYEARKFGVRSAMPSARAARLCPSLVFVRPDFSKYSAASDSIREIFQSVTPKVEPLSLDEAYLDVTENLLGEPLAAKIAAYIKRRIHAELGLTASAGVGPNKFIAKVASDLRKPDGLVIVPPERVREFVDPLPVEKFWGVGPATAKKLHSLGLRKAIDVRTCQPAILEASLGKFGLFLYGLAQGIDPRPVESDWDPKSRGSETTFDKDLLEIPRLKQVLEDLSTEVSEDLRTMGRLARTVTLKVRYSDFTTITRSRTVGRPLDEAVRIAEIAAELLVDSTEAGRVPVRLLGVSASHLLHVDDPRQLWLDLPGV
jgi:DNA polymerase-4